MLALDNVTKRYNDQPVVDDVTLDFGAGRTHVLIGQSGCGKSTILRMLIGLVHPDEGRVTLEDASLTTLDLAEVRKRYGYVIQEGGLFPHLTAGENLELLADYHRWPKDKTQQRVQELSELTRFPEDGLLRFPAQLSGGQRQRVSLMRALLLDPDILLLDEPLGALDPLIRDELQQQLNEIFRELGKTVVLVTHDLNEAAFFGDQIILLCDGKVMQKGTADQLVNEPEQDFVRDFIRAQRGYISEVLR